MGYRDGVILGTERMRGNLPPSSGYNLVLVAEGYTHYEQDLFVEHCQQFVKTFFATSPFDKCGGVINVFRVHVASLESGAKDPYWWPYCTGSGYWPRTFLDASYCTDGLDRLMDVNQDLAHWLLNQQLREWEKALVLVNSPRLAGSGGRIAVVTVHEEGDWVQTAIHELGHTAFGLADEYPYYQGCGVDEPDANRYTGDEYSEGNVTTKTKALDLKWRHVWDAKTPIPTTRNADCSRCDSQNDPGPEGAVGLFEGAGFYHCGVFRPSFHCKMRELEFDFCDVCEDVIRDTLLNFGEQSDLYVTPWGFAQDPPTHPLWKSPDIEWDAPNNRIKVTVRNRGRAQSGGFHVRVRVTPPTTVPTSQLAAGDVILDKTKAVANLAAGARATVSIPFTPAEMTALTTAVGAPAFTVVVDIEADECHRHYKSARSNFGVVTAAQAQAGIAFALANPWASAATAALELELAAGAAELLAAIPAEVALEPGEVELEAGEVDQVSLRFHAAAEAVGILAEGGDSLDVSVYLDGRLVGGFSPKIEAP